MLGKCLMSEVTLNMHEVRILNMHEVGTWLTQFATWLKQFATRLMHFGDASIEADYKRPLFLQFSSFGQECTPDMAYIHTCPTSISKTIESIKHGTNRIGPMQVSEPVRTKNMEKTWPQVWLNSGLERKPMIEPCGWLKATFSTPTRNSWKTIKGTHQEIIADIEEKNALRSRQ